MRFAFAALIALALGLLPAGAARAMPDAPAAPMSCHDMGQSPDVSHHPPSDDMRACAKHCLSQVNAPLNFTRLPGPSLLAAVDAAPTVALDAGTPRLRDPPDPPPPRS
ncbi:MAG TPA: hypothetical protein VJ748_00495 [Vitreimonas sp.]|jgi:hypothetical protein|nr:hypothetical protein [Vitreimonas sp.]